jgi:hypothetical protein
MLRTLVRSAAQRGAAIILILLALFGGASTHLFAQASTAVLATWHICSHIVCSGYLAHPFEKLVVF